MMSSDLSKQFSLDYLLSGSKTSVPAESVPSRNSSCDPVFEALSQPILRKLNEAKDQTMKQHELFDAVAGIYGDVRIEAMSEVIQRLVSAGRIRVVQEDRYGNHLLQTVQQKSA